VICAAQRDHRLRSLAFPSSSWSIGQTGFERRLLAAGAVIVVGVELHLSVRLSAGRCVTAPETI